MSRGLQMDFDNQLKQYDFEYQAARRRFLLQAVFLFACCMYIGLDAIDSTRWFGILMFILAGFSLCSLSARLAVLRMIHKGRIYAMRSHYHYQASIAALYAKYGDGVAQEVGTMPDMPQEFRDE